MHGLEAALVVAQANRNWKSLWGRIYSWGNSERQNNHPVSTSTDINKSSHSTRDTPIICWVASNQVFCRTCLGGSEIDEWNSRWSTNHKDDHSKWIIAVVKFKYLLCRNCWQNIRSDSSCSCTADGYNTTVQPRAEPDLWHLKSGVWLGNFQR